MPLLEKQQLWRAKCQQQLDFFRAAALHKHNHCDSNLKLFASARNPVHRNPITAREKCFSRTLLTPFVFGFCLNKPTLSGVCRYPYDWLYSLPSKPLTGCHNLCDSAGCRGVPMCFHFNKARCISQKQWITSYHQYCLLWCTTPCSYYADDRKFQRCTTQFSVSE